MINQPSSSSTNVTPADCLLYAVDAKLKLDFNHFFLAHTWLFFVILSVLPADLENILYNWETTGRDFRKLRV